LFEQGTEKEIQTDMTIYIKLALEMSDKRLYGKEMVWKQLDILGGKQKVRFPPHTIKQTQISNGLNS